MCSAESPRIDLWGLSVYCSSNCINVSRWSPGFLSATAGYIQPDPVFTNLLTMFTTARIVLPCLSCLWSNSKCFRNFVWVSEIDFVSVENQNHLNPESFTLLSFRFSCGSVNLCTLRFSIVMHDYFCSSNNRKTCACINILFHMKT